MMALGAVQAQPPSTVVAVGLLLGAAVALTKWESRGGKTSDKLVYIGGGALLGAAALAFWPKKKSDPTLTGKKSVMLSKTCKGLWELAACSIFRRRITMVLT